MGLSFIVSCARWLPAAAHVRRGRWVLVDTHKCDLSGQGPSAETRGHLLPKGSWPRIPAAGPCCNACPCLRGKESAAALEHDGRQVRAALYRGVLEHQSPRCRNSTGIFGSSPQLTTLPQTRVIAALLCAEPNDPDADLGHRVPAVSHHADSSIALAWDASSRLSAWYALLQLLLRCPVRSSRTWQSRTGHVYWVSSGFTVWNALEAHARDVHVRYTAELRFALLCKGSSYRCFAGSARGAPRAVAFGQERAGGGPAAARRAKGTAGGRRQSPGGGGGGVGKSPKRPALP